MSDRRPKKNVDKPFGDLKALLKRRNITLAPGPKDPQPAGTKVPAVSGKKVQEMSDLELFWEAMADVTPINFNKSSTRGRCPDAAVTASCQQEDDSTAALKILIREGRGFIVSQTPEYMESDSPGGSSEILRRLHQGQYAIQDFLDLHGLRVPEAEQEFEHFIRRSIRNSLRAVLIVHGRGLTSPKEPVLKNKVYTWLTRGRLRKWVVAFTSARSCDGGAGATYVLLRQRPLTKSQHRKNARLKSH